MRYILGLWDVRASEFQFGGWGGRGEGVIVWSLRLEGVISCKGTRVRSFRG